MTAIINNSQLEQTNKKSLTDSFTKDSSRGKTLGKLSSSGNLRQGIDIEKLISIDNEALRFQPLLKPGWGRQGLAYGPYERCNGLAFSIFLLNGHNTSCIERIESLGKRVERWLIGSEAETPKQRLLEWLAHGEKGKTLRRLWWWVMSTGRISKRLKYKFPLPTLDENLAVGWFPKSAPSNPIVEGNGLVVRGTGKDNGELCARVGDNLLPIFRGLQNVQTHYIVILREQGAMYYGASVTNAHGLGDYPYMRPLGIDAFSRDETVYAGLHQSVSGQFGFWVDTRVYGAQVEKIPALDTWYGTAQGADNLKGDGKLGSLDGIFAQQGGFWQVYQGKYQLTARGAVAIEANSLAILNCDAPSGLIHVLSETTGKTTGIRLIWRFQDENNFWCFLAHRDQCMLQIKEDGKWANLAVSDLWFLSPQQTNSLQVLDDGETFSLSLNGQLVFNKHFSDRRFQNAQGVGIGSIEPNHDLFLHSFEAHPRSIPIPPELDLGAPWLREGTQVAIKDNFEGKLGDLIGKTTTTGNKVWQRTIGKGLLELTGENALRVKANPQQPNPGRTAYTIAWDHPEFADMAVDITPPGTKRGQGEKGRAGLIFWQDEDNYIIINNWLDDCYGGASISSFFRLNGFEELYDAVWTNVGKRILWGVSHRLRIVFDGMHYTVWINHEPVLYRALTDVYPKIAPLKINRLGIVANWEWGNDTGSTFKNFIVKV